MKISYLSDIHADFWVPFTFNQIKWEKRTKEFIEKLIETDEGERDILCLSGDYSHFNVQTMWILETFSQHYKQVFFTYGNHCMYLVSKSQEDKYNGHSQNRIDELYSKSIELKNVHPLFTDETFIYQGVTFGGNPMWYPISTTEQKMFFNNISNDSRLIKGVDIHLEHKKSIANYSSMMNRGIDVMISHVPLCHLRSHEKYASTACYFTQVDVLPKHVVMGHSHERAIYKKAGSSLYMNCLGYPHDSLGKPDIRNFTI